MSDKKISALPAASVPLAGTEVLPIVQSGTTVKVASVDITGGVPVGKGAGNIASNTVVGVDALTSNVSGSSITAIGNGALKVCTGIRNTAVGASALTSNTSGIYNAAVGTFALSSVVDGTRNTAIGYAAGNLLNNGSGGVFIGYLAQPQGISDSNTIVIGDGATGNGSNTTTIGNGTTANTIIPAGNATLTNGNLVIGTDGKGIDFTATPGTGTSELLDDYEEGTWTAKLYDASSGGNASATTATGYYTKIGNQVTLTVGNFNNIDTTGMTGGNFMRMGDLPFTPAQNSAGSMTVGNWDFDSGYTAIFPVTVGTSSRLAFFQVGDNVAEVFGIGVGALTSGTSDIGRMTITYFV
jgi:hypothetical protein